MHMQLWATLKHLTSFRAEYGPTLLAAVAGLALFIAVCVADVSDLLTGLTGLAVFVTAITVLVTSMRRYERRIDAVVAAYLLTEHGLTTLTKMGPNGHTAVHGAAADSKGAIHIVDVKWLPTRKAQELQGALPKEFNPITVSKQLRD